MSVEIVGALSYACPFLIEEMAEKYPNLIFLEKYFCDTNFYLIINLYQGKKYKQLYNEQIADNDFEIKYENPDSCWLKYKRMSKKDLENILDDK